MAGQKPGFMGTTEERFWPKVQKTDGCWLWTAALYGNGYGSFKQEGQGCTGAHRMSYKLAYGEIPDGHLVLHRCDNRRCVRPDHLFLGDSRDNIVDCITKGRFYRNSDTHCPNGHPYPEGQRRCQVCLQEKQNRQCASRRARTQAVGLRKNWCPNRHLRTQANTLVREDGSKMCRECRAAVMRRYRAKRSALKRAA